MVPRIRLLLDYPRTEMRREGWGITRVAGSFTFSALIDGKYQKSARPEKLWQETNTSVCMCLPSPFYAGFEEDPSFVANQIKLADLNTGMSDDGGPLFHQVPRDNRLLSLRADRAAPITGMSLWQALMDALNLSLASALCWAWQTKSPLRINEGWGATITPHGTSTDQAQVYSQFAFGEVYLLELIMNGFAVLYENMGTQLVSKWVKRAVFPFHQGGVNHTIPFQLAVIPFGGKYISFQFSQAQTAYMSASRRVSTDTFKTSTFLYDVASNGKVPTYDPVLQQWVKTKAAQLSMSMRCLDHAYDVRMFRVRYPSPVTFTILPEDLGYERPIAKPSLDCYGFEPAGTLITKDVVNIDDAVWDPASGTRPDPKITMNPTADGVYSPEIWYYDKEIKADTWTPPYEVYDASEQWTKIRFQKTCFPDVTEAEVSFHDEARFPSMYRRGGPTRIEIDDIVRWEGVAPRHLPTPGGIPKLPDGLWVDARLEAKELLWYRMNWTPIMNAASLDNKKVGPFLKDKVQRCGFADAEIVVVDAEINDMDMEEFTDNNSAKVFNVDSYCGDVARDCVKKFGIQERPLVRLRRDDDLVKIYLAPHFEAGVTPDPLTIFYIDGSLMPSGTDYERWNLPGTGDGKSHFKITSNLEFVVNWPDFNLLKATSAKGTGTDAEGVAVYIEPHPDVLEDNTVQEFQGFIQAKTIGPPEITAQDDAALMRQARILYQEHNRELLQVQFDGEWQPNVDVDQFIMIVGKDDLARAVSFGVFRISAMDCEISRDIMNSAPLDLVTWEWAANYTAAYVGPSASLTYPMFTTILPTESV